MTVEITDTSATSVVEPLYVSTAGVVSAAGLGLAPLAERLRGRGACHDLPGGGVAGAYAPPAGRAVRG
ncbi:hypothetical protein ACFXDJ_13530, partial [Streptomyces sp. NPDC059443]|uniref:hypothetical protein n=1 Tax=Streptomyces sp. NPDC059443 TaxID=3346831 RepID=UPI00369198FE